MSHVIYNIFRMFVNFVTLDGLRFVMREEKLIAEHLIMHHLRFCQEKNMILQLIFGVWEY